jgi:hypothetical protein
MNKWLTMLLGSALALANTTAGWCNTVDTIVNDMKGSHEATPHGVPSGYDWRYGPVIHSGNNPPANANHAQFWLHVYEPEAGNTSSSGRVQIANAKLWILRKDNNQWVSLQHEDTLVGSMYPESYQGSTKTPDLQSANPGVSVRSGSQSSAGSGYMFHGWISWMHYIDRTNIAGVWASCDARLINDSNAKYLLAVGVDYKDQNWSVLSDAGIGKFKYVTSSWKSFNMHTMTETALRNNPPPPVRARQNLIRNGGFTEQSGFQWNINGWYSWNNGSDSDYQETANGNQHATHYNGSRNYQVYTYQWRVGLENGNYTLRAKYKSSGGQSSATFGVINYGGTRRELSLNTAKSSWTSISLTNINVTNGQAEIYFWSNASSGQWINFDDVEFFKQ